MFHGEIASGTITEQGLVRAKKKLATSGMRYTDEEAHLYFHAVVKLGENPTAEDIFTEVDSSKGDIVTDKMRKIEGDFSSDTT
ncbi:hypothetical protein M0802_016393 [Mischocyttarus mexicanus]|nr:hypothetical protein M0802_016393 [Mischocyttarus mexicanus]